jgi:AcrR family transcriptional regulator
MARIADDAGVARATLYKYFPDVESILRAGHEREIARHLARLARVRDRSVEPAERLAGVLEAYASIRQESSRHGDVDLAALLHAGQEVAHAEGLITEMLKQLIADAVATGAVRDDVAPGELARYCLHALGAARTAPSKEAVERLVQVTLAGLRRRQ